MSNSMQHPEQTSPTTTNPAVSADLPIPGGVEDIFDAGREYQRRIERRARQLLTTQLLAAADDSERGPRAWVRLTRRFSSARRQTTCPDWCQSKPLDDPDGPHTGPHTWPAIPAMDGLDDDKDVDGNSSALVSVHPAEPGTDEGALIWVDAPHLTMTAAQAHEAGLALLTVSSWALDHKVTS